MSVTPARLLAFDEIEEDEEEKDEQRAEPVRSVFVNSGDHSPPTRYVGLNRKAQSAYGLRFWSGFVDNGGKPWKACYDDLRDDSNTNLLPTRLTEWCCAMSERYLPWCKQCRGRVRPCTAQSKHNPGAVY